MGERSIQEKYQAWQKCPGMNEELLRKSFSLITGSWIN